MIIRMNSVTKVNVSVRHIVTAVFLIWGHLRSDYKSCRSTIKLVHLMTEDSYFLISELVRLNSVMVKNRLAYLVKE